jgi:hypothetical protein
MPDDVNVNENLATIIRIAESMVSDKGLSETVKGKADRIYALAEQCLAVKDDGQKPGEVK